MLPNQVNFHIKQKKEQSFLKYQRKKSKRKYAQHKKTAGVEYNEINQNSWITKA